MGKIGYVKYILMFLFICMSSFGDSVQRSRNICTHLCVCVGGWVCESVAFVC